MAASVGTVFVGTAVLRCRSVGRWAASAAVVVLAAGVLALVPAGGPAAAQLTPQACAAPSASTDYDVDDDGLIEVCSLAQLNAVRWDLDGDGTADVYRDGTHDTAWAQQYAAAFPNAATAMGCPASGCAGYELMADLDFDTNGSGTADAGDTYWNSGKGWTPIGESVPVQNDFFGAYRAWEDHVGNSCWYSFDDPCHDKHFSAVFDGNGRTIANLHISGTLAIAGLFGYVHLGEIRNVGLTAPDFGSVTGSRIVGALVGKLHNGLVSGSWSGIDVSGRARVGGLVGVMFGNAWVEGSRSVGDVTADHESGGLVGLYNGIRIAASYAAGSVTCRWHDCGGLIGYRVGGAVTASYATGDVTCGTAGGCGGLAGLLRSGNPSDGPWDRYWRYVTPPAVSRTFEANYSTGRVTAPAGDARGGLIGDCAPWVGHAPRVSYWDTEASGVSSSGCRYLFPTRSAPSPTGYTTEQLQAPTGYTGIYAGWNVDVDGDGTADDPWDFGTSSQYPVLKWGSLDPDAQRPGTTDPPVVVPVVSISGGSGVTEGGTASFTITASPAPSSPIAVKVGVSESGSFGASGAATVTVSGASATYSVTTADDRVDEADGSVTATLQDGSGYTVSSTAGSASVSVSDDDAPAAVVVVGGSFESPTVSAHGGTWHQFADGTAGLGWSVSGGALELMRGILGGASHGDQHAELDGTGSVTISQVLSTEAGSVYTVSFDYKARPDTAAHTNGLSAMWNGTEIAAGITLGSSWRTHTVEVTGTGSDTLAFSDTGTSDGVGTFLDNVSVIPVAPQPQQTQEQIQTPEQPPVVPVVSISAGSGVTEGGTASFTVTASPVPSSPVIVKVGVSESGSFGASGAATVTLSGATATYTVATSDDQVDEADGTVTATLQDGSGYTVSATAGSASVRVSDDDDPPPVVPVVGISGGSAVTEGGTASFAITASPAPSSPITVKVAVSESGSFGASGAATVTVSGAATTYAVTTSDDQVDEADGTVTVTLGDGTGYTVSATAGSASVGVSDNDDPPPPPVVPVVSITAGSAITEGGTASFTITASPAPSSPITVKVAVSESGSFGASGAATVTVSGAATTYAVTTSDDQVDEADGTVTVTLGDGSGYTVSASAGSASVGVSDDDDPPPVVPVTPSGPVLSVGDATAVEGGRLPVMEFTVRLSEPASGTVRVHFSTRPVTATAGSDYMAGTYDLTFSPGQTEKQAYIWIWDDRASEGTETFEAVLSDARGAPIGDGVAVGTITDND